MTFEYFIENKRGSFQVFVENKGEAVALLETLLSLDAYTDQRNMLKATYDSLDSRYPRQEFFAFTGESREHGGIKRYETAGYTSREYFKNLYRAHEYTPFMFSEVMQYYNDACNISDCATECDVYDLMGV